MDFSHLIKDSQIFWKIVLFSALFFVIKISFRRKYGRKGYTRKGEYVKSRAEKIIADYLLSRGVRYRYEQPVCGYRPDFYLPDYDAYIEFWGLPNLPQYRDKMNKKKAVYASNGVKVIDVYSKDLNHLNGVIGRRLGIA